MRQVLQEKEPRRILVVDDKDAWCLACHITYYKFYKIETAKDGETALAVAKGYQPHVALVDILLPGFSGIEVIRRFKDVSPQTVSLAVSALKNPTVQVESIRAGAKGFLDKLAGKERFLSAVKGALELWPNRGDEKSGTTGEIEIRCLSHDQDVLQKRIRVGNGNDLARFFDPGCDEWWYAFDGFLMKIATQVLMNIDWELQFTPDEVTSDFYYFFLKEDSKAIEKFDMKKGSFRTWIRTVMKGQILHKFRGNRRHEAPSIEDLRLEPATTKYNPQVVADNKEQHSHLFNRLEKLPKEEREVLLTDQDSENQTSQQESKRKPSERTKRRRRSTGFLRLKSWFLEKFGDDEN